MAGKKKQQEVDNAFKALGNSIAAMQKQLTEAQIKMSKQGKTATPIQVAKMKKASAEEAQKQAQDVLAFFNALNKELESDPAVKTATVLPSPASSQKSKAPAAQPKPNTKATAPTTTPSKQKTKEKTTVLPTPPASDKKNVGDTKNTGGPGNPPVNPVDPGNTEDTGNKPTTGGSNLAQKRPLQPDDYQLRMGHGWTVSDGLFEHQPESKRRKRDVPYPRHVNYSYRSMYGLSTLQISANAPVSMCALDVACDHIWKCQPQEVRELTMIPPPNGPALWSNDQKARDRMYQQMNLAVYQDEAKKRYRFYTDLKRRQWVIWPIWVEDIWGSDYVTICWRAAPSDPAAPKVYDRLSAFTIIDPRRNPLVGSDGRHPVVTERLDRIESRLMEFLQRGGYDTSSPFRYEVLCSPMALGETSSGERCFANVKEMLGHIRRWYYDGMDDEMLGFGVLSQWVLPYQQRVEMAGINAWVLMASFDYGARIAVECIQPNSRVYVTANGAKRMVVPYDLAAPYAEPAISSYDYLLPPDGNYRAYPKWSTPMSPIAPNTPPSSFSNSLASVLKLASSI